MAQKLFVASLLGALGAGFSVRYCWWRPKQRGTPLLMYHQVGPQRAGSSLNRWRVEPAVLERQLSHLQERGMRGISLRQLLEQPESAEPRVVLTFDDGYASVLSEVWPRLQRRGFGATVFVISQRVGGVNDWDQERPGDPLLSAAEIRRLHEAGIEIGSHGATHRRLNDLSDAELHEEVAGSRQALASLVGAEIESFCYPYGTFDDRVIHAVQSAGYRAATAILAGISPDLSDPFRLRRVPVHGDATFLDFRLALTRGRSRLF